MNVGTKVGGFLAGLVLVGVVGAGVGTLAGPVDTAPVGHDGTTHAGGDAHEPEAEPGGHDDVDDAHAGHGSAAPNDEAGEAAGTASTQDGYRLALDPTDDEIRFQVLDPAGAPVVETEVLHERPLHLIVVGRDLVGYAHLHPEVAADGTWSVARPELAPGSYRVVADLQPVGGPELALAGDLAVPGTVPPVAVPEPATTATADDLTVTLDGHPEVGDTELAFTVTSGRPGGRRPSPTSAPAATWSPSAPTTWPTPTSTRTRGRAATTRATRLAPRRPSGSPPVPHRGDLPPVPRPPVDGAVPHVRPHRGGARP